MAVTFEQALKAALDELPNIIRDTFQRLPFEFQVYVSEQMQDDTGSPEARIKAARTKNPSDQLRVVTGRLLSAFVPGKPGYAGSYNRASATVYEFIVGIDLAQVPYARIQELGGTAGNGARIPARPYIAPAFAAFEKEQLENITKRIMERLLG